MVVQLCGDVMDELLSGAEHSLVHHIVSWRKIYVFNVICSKHRDVENNIVCSIRTCCLRVGCPFLCR